MGLIRPAGQKMHLEGFVGAEMTSSATTDSPRLIACGRRCCNAAKLKAHRRPDSRRQLPCLSPHPLQGLQQTLSDRWRQQALPEALEAFLAAAAQPSPGLAVGAAANSLVYLAGIKVLLKGLNWEGVASSWFLGTLSYAAFGPGSYAVVCLYFIVGSLVTKLKLEQKQLEGIAQERSGRRGLGSVLGSGVAGVVCAALALSTGNVALWRAGFVASFASKLADTVSSEVGKAYGKTTYLITSLQKVPRGTEGAVSAEGTAAGLAAAAAVGGIALALGQVSPEGAACATAAAFVANILESIVGATLQGKVEWLTNDVVNMLQILAAAGLAVVLVGLVGA